MLSRPLTRLQPTRMAAVTRLSALSAHFSSSAPTQAAPAKLSTSSASEPSVVFEAIHSLRKVTLNRPSKLNVLNADVVVPLKDQIQVGHPWPGGRLPNVSAQLAGRGWGARVEWHADAVVICDMS